MKDLKCSVHGTKLVEKEVPVFYGMPTPDSDIFEIDSISEWSYTCAISGWCVYESARFHPGNSG
jgi:hypothetical protein